MCIKCDFTNVTQVSHREVSVKCIQKVQESKDYIRSNGEQVLKVEWFISYERSLKFYIGYVTFGYFDGHQMQTDFIQTVIKAA